MVYSSAFVTPVASVSSFRGSALACTTASNSPAAVTMSAEAPVSRRAALAAAAAFALFSAAPAAQAGEGARQSFFGGGSQSSPFTYSLKSGEPVYEKLGDEELEFHKGMVSEGKARLESTDEFIKEKNWEFVRAEIRLQMQNMRKSQLRLTQALETKDEKKKAESEYVKFKTNIENLDFAARSKDQSKSSKYRAESLKSLDSWASAVGISI